MKRTKIIVEPIECSRCGGEANHAVWPYLRGGEGPNGETLTWWRCSPCNLLISNVRDVLSTNGMDRETNV